MDADLRRAERDGDTERARRLRQHAGLAPYRVWYPDARGLGWEADASWEPRLALTEAADALFVNLGRVARRGEGYLVAWCERDGYLAVARYATDPPFAAEILMTDEDRYYAGRLGVRPTLLGRRGDDLDELDGLGFHSEEFRYDGICE